MADNVTPLPDSPIASPCVRNCCLDEHDICIGCYRSLSEITGWLEASEREKKEILLRCERRSRTGLNPFSVISPDTVQGYKETNYYINATSPFILRVGEASPVLLALYQAYNVTSCAWITAWNPFSQPLHPSENHARSQRLLHEIKTQHLPFLPGEGKHPSGQWPGESGYLILGMSLNKAKLLGAAYEQNAVIWCDDAAVPELILLR